MVRSRQALTLVEIAVAAFILAALVVPLHDLPRVERTQVVTGTRELVLRAHALDSLSAAAAQVAGATDPTSTRAVTLDAAVHPLAAREIVSVRPVPGTTGLTEILVSLARDDAPPHAIATYVPDRALALRQPLITTEVPR